MRIELVNPQQIILEEIAEGHTQRSVALTYAFLLRQEPKTADWKKINQAIMRRWKGKKALSRIKEMAWRFCDPPKPKA